MMVKGELQRDQAKVKGNRSRSNSRSKSPKMKQAKQKYELNQKYVAQNKKSFDEKSTNQEAIFLHSPFILKYSKDSKVSNKIIYQQAIKGIQNFGIKNQKIDQTQEIVQEFNNIAKYYTEKQEISKLCVRIYTKYSFVYKNINLYLRSADYRSKNNSDYDSKYEWEQVKDLMPYCFILNEYLINNSLTKGFNGIVYRGSFLTDQMIQTIEAMEWVHINNQKHGYCQKIWLGCNENNHLKSGVQIQELSEYYEEQEILLRSGIRFKIKGMKFEEERHKIFVQCLDFFQIK